ncbi:NAD-binding protein [Fomitiporia mediterranea MF3/22]|uniref:NAD-binding protein n=1 Tax=Fomitiporia mediterranea (strain MF3/22) TaxID=694068 RepID=UPI0004407A57|nr:NAD-binding protein [Fomitiporia mediterranea MF3/22]EJC97974.1 NAD-binding protein [Fomitiporia mediterranea MF3/22]
MGFDPAKALAGVDLRSKTILVTGSTSGIGFATAQILVQRGAKVYLGARNAEKAEACIKRIEDSLTKFPASAKETEEKGQAIFHQVDLDDPKEAKQSAEAFLQREERLDVLSNCAAATIEDFQIGANGIQHLMNVNYFSTLIFTETLLPLLKKTAEQPGSDVRIVNVSSDGHKFLPNDLHFKSKDDFNVNYGNSFLQSWKRSSVSNLLRILWTRELQRRLIEEGSSIIAVALSPGSVHTENTDMIVIRLKWPISTLFFALVRLTFMNVRDGAGTLIIAALSPKVRTEADKYKGGYLTPIGKLGKPSKQAQSAELATELMKTTEELRKEWGL